MRERALCQAGTNWRKITTAPLQLYIYNIQAIKDIILFHPQTTLNTKECHPKLNVVFSSEIAISNFQTIAQLLYDSVNPK